MYVHFITRSTHLENLFVAVDHSELSNKLVEKVSIIKTVYLSDSSCIAAERIYRRAFCVHVVRSRDTTYRTVNGSEETLFVSDELERPEAYLIFLYGRICRCSTRSSNKYPTIIVLRLAQQIWILTSTA